MDKPVYIQLTWKHSLSSQYTGKFENCRGLHFRTLSFLFPPLAPLSLYPSSTTLNDVTEPVFLNARGVQIPQKLGNDSVSKSFPE